MIAIDRSALIAIALNEREADPCAAPLGSEDRLLISAGTVAEALIVTGQRNVSEEMGGLIDRLGLEIIGITPTTA